MKVTQTPGVMGKFRRTLWRFQQTFQTPLQDLDRFVPLIFSGHEPIQSATVTLDEIVFEPKNLARLLAPHYTLTEEEAGITITAGHRGEAVPLLKAALADWVDFLFVPTPKPFVIYADHDDYVTFFANTKSSLNHPVGALEAGGYRVIRGWRREF